MKNISSKTDASVPGRYRQPISRILKDGICCGSPSRLAYNACAALATHDPIGRKLVSGPTSFVSLAPKFVDCKPTEGAYRIPR